MRTFAVICLILVFLSIQHLMNWGSRKMYLNPREDERSLIFLGLIVAALISWGCLYYITLWMYPLISN